MSELKLLSAADLATQLGVKVSTVIDWRHKGTGPVFAKLGRRVYYALADVEKWIAGNRRQIRRVEEAPPPANDPRSVSAGAAA